MSNLTFSTYEEKLKDLRGDLREMLPEESILVFDNDASQLNEIHKQILKIQVGQKAPDFTLSNASGHNINLYEKLKSSKVILVFYRGTWCPYCNLGLAHYQAAFEEFKSSGAEMIAISPQTPDESLSIKEKNNLEFEVLSDNGNLVAQLYTTVFRNGDSALEEMKKLGFDFDGFYGNDSKEIPVPAVFIIDENAIVTFAKTEGGDYRNRTEAREIIKSLNK